MIVKHTPRLLKTDRRHEANHNIDPAFECTIEGCRKPFQRSDLLSRHMERQSVSSGNRFLTTTDRQRHGTTPGIPLDQMSSRSSFSSAPPLSHPTHTFEPTNPEYVPYITSHLSQPATSPMPISSAVSPFTTYPEFPSPHQQYFPEFLDTQSMLRARRSTESHSLPPDLTYNLSASESYASSESCYSPFPETLASPAISMGNLHAYSPAYSNLRSHTVSTTPEIMGQHQGFQQQYSGNSVLRNVGDEKMASDAYGSLGAAAALYVASTGTINSPTMDDTVSNALLSTDLSEDDPKTWEACANISRAIIHDSLFGSNTHLARR